MKVSTKEAKAPPAVPEKTYKTFGLRRDSRPDTYMQQYFLITVTVSTSGQAMSVERSPQSWLLFEALFRLEQAMSAEIAGGRIE